MPRGHYVTIPVRQSDTLDAQQLRITELSERLEEASQYLEERANGIEDNALKEVSWKREQVCWRSRVEPTRGASHTGESRSWKAFFPQRIVAIRGYGQM